MAGVPSWLSTPIQVAHKASPCECWLLMCNSAHTSLPRMLCSFARTLQSRQLLKAGVWKGRLAVHGVMPYVHPSKSIPEEAARLGKDLPRQMTPVTASCAFCQVLLQEHGEADELGRGALCS